MLLLQCAFQQKHLTGVQAGRSFFLQPSGSRKYLGDFFELWLGLFQSTILGSVPYLNVDVSHKAFPKRYNNMVDLIKDIGGNPNQELQPRSKSTLNQHLKGMDIVYNRPGNAGRKIHKFLNVEDIPARCMFDQDGKQISVLQYFQKIGYRIQNPNLPCLKIGGANKNITIPIELCTLSDAQVRVKLNIFFVQRVSIIIKFSIFSRFDRL